MFGITEFNRKFYQRLIFFIIFRSFLYYVYIYVRESQKVQCILLSTEL